MSKRNILADQKQRERISAMSHVFRKTDSVLTGEHIQVVVEDKPGMAPSWTDGKTITFNKAVIGSISSIEEIIRLSGLNYHELAHCWYTPRSTSVLVKTIANEGLFNAFNVLEDQRIETLLTTKHPSAIPYLVSTFMRYCITSEKSWEVNYALVYGRKFIPADIRAEFKRRFALQAILPQLEAVIDEYRTLTYPKDTDRGLELVREFGALMSQFGNPSDPHGHTDGTRPTNITGGRPVSQREQQDIADNIEDMDEELENNQPTPSEPSDDADSTDGDDADDADGSGDASDDDADEDADDDADGSGGGSSNADSDADAEGSGDSAGGADGGGDLGNDQGDDSTPSTSGGGNGASNVDGGSQSPMDSDEVRKLLEQIAEQFENMPSVQEDVSAKQHAIVHGDGDVDVDLDGKGTKDAPVPAADVATARKFSTVLDQLRSDSDPGWKTHTASGKVNMQRVINGADYDKIWDRWIEGNNDAADIECVIAIDKSGSMQYQIREASRAMWIIKRAMEILDANVTVISYSDTENTNLVYKKEQKVSKTSYRQMKASGSTMPRKATVEAVSILEASRRTNKIFITITDGQWGYGWQCEEVESIIEEMGKRGITTALAFLGYHSKQYGIDAHKCQVAAGVNNPMELVEFAKQIVKESMKVKR